MAKEIVLADIMEDKLKGEVMDLQHAGSFLPAKIVKASPDYHETAGSDVCVITAGVRQQIGESRYVFEGSFNFIFPMNITRIPDIFPNFTIDSHLLSATSTCFKT